MSVYLDNGASNSKGAARTPTAAAADPSEGQLRQAVRTVDEKIDSGLTNAAQRTYDAVSQLDDAFPTSSGPKASTTSTTTTTTTTTSESSSGTPLTRFDGTSGILSARRYADRAEGLDQFGAEEAERERAELVEGEPRMSERVVAVTREVFGIGKSKGAGVGAGAGASVEREDEAEKASSLE